MLRIAKRADHRPADPREARKLVSELRTEDPLRSLEQVVEWIESLTALPEVRLDKRFEALGVFEETATLLERRVARDYGRSGRLPAVREQRLWNAAYRLWRQLAIAYQLCMMEYDAGVSGVASAQLRAPVMGCHAMRALRKEMKWVMLRHGRVEGRAWQEAARIEQPALLLWCREDKVIDPSAMALYAARIPHASQVMLEGCGHMSLMERPGESAEAVALLIERGAPAGPPQGVR